VHFASAYNIFNITIFAQQQKQIVEHQQLSQNQWSNKDFGPSVWSAKLQVFFQAIVLPYELLGSETDPICVNASWRDGECDLPT
jgi:hypothetical protein